MAFGHGTAAREPERELNVARDGDEIHHGRLSFLLLIGWCYLPAKVPRG
jgi:hypothetical protein